jgi:hypothetical protein
MTLEATTTVRKMRGGAQSYLIAASDGRFYVVKFQNNPQHRRILINELMCCELLAQLGVEAAPGTPLLVTPEFCARFPATALEFGGRTHPPKPVPGWHFASLFPWRSGPCSGVRLSSR